MHPELNPYNPGSGAQPMHLAGRDSEIAAFDLLIVRTKKHLQSRPMVLSGLRGVGKTVLLRRLKGLADHHGWITIKFEARKGENAQQEARKIIAAELQSAVRQLVPLMSAGDYIRKALSTVTSFTATAGVNDHVKYFWPQSDGYIWPRLGRTCSQDRRVSLLKALWDWASEWPRSGFPSATSGRRRRWLWSWRHHAKLKRTKHRSSHIHASFYNLLTNAVINPYFHPEALASMGLPAH
ncbi:AAA family ATPase (plasmid) [Pseudarthrobacter psychrotolerans]|uniref:AAA family ATPase n=1 Tax=Pseudarthrobacter psychrotolerans TaxID=2697569 RepID=A0A6P1NVG7_9MICC|nr:AAA family ATPase [Pseudarthrobacter psychrotolerans]